jgi:chromosome segregation ATPase
LRQQLNELIEERERWLEEINKGQAEIVAARVSAEKFRQRDQVLTTENEKIKAENFSHQIRTGGQKAFRPTKPPTANTSSCQDQG